jgi:hypothetical protein
MRCYTVLQPPYMVNPNGFTGLKMTLGRASTPSKSPPSFLSPGRRRVASFISLLPSLMTRANCLPSLATCPMRAALPPFLKIDNEKVGSCYAIREHNRVPTEYQPETPLPAELVKEIDWEYATNKILLIPIPILVPLPYGREIESTTFSNGFAREIQTISSKHGFWAKSMANVINQVETKNHTEKVFNKISSSTALSRACTPACATTKGLRIMTFVSSPFIDTSLVGKKFKAKQASIKEFFRRNPTPARVEIGNNDEGIEVQIPIHSASENTVPPAAPVPVNPPAEFYAQLIKTTKDLQAPVSGGRVVK